MSTIIILRRAIATFLREPQEDNAESDCNSSGIGHFSLRASHRDEIPSRKLLSSSLLRRGGNPRGTEITRSDSRRHTADAGFWVSCKHRGSEISAASFIYLSVGSRPSNRAVSGAREARVLVAVVTHLDASRHRRDGAYSVTFDWKNPYCAKRATCTATYPRYRHIRPPTREGLEGEDITWQIRPDPPSRGHYTRDLAQQGILLSSG